MSPRASLPAGNNVSDDDDKRSREELIAELKSLRRQYVDLKIMEHERNKAEAALRESEARYRQIVETASDIIYRTDERGYFKFANDAAVRIIGYPLNEIIGMNYLELIRPDYRKKAFRHYLNQVIEKIPSTYLEFPAVNREGKEVWIGQNAQMIFQGEKFVEMQAVARDITPRKKAELERTHLENQLRQAQKMESIGRLAGGISHDFNNILGVILAYTSILEYENISKDQSALSLDAIKKTIGRARALINELLTLAQKTEPSLEHLDVNNLVREFTSLVVETFPRSISFTLSLDEHVGGFLADPNQIHQLLLNLYVNARDAMPNGGSLTVSTIPLTSEEAAKEFPDAAPGPYARISVKDTGMGMDEQVRSRIFEPFFTTKEHGKGTGLGLSVVYGIVQSHHGFIDVESAPGKGSTFHVYFPRREGGALVSQRYKSFAADAVGGTETILVVDDEKLLKDALFQELTKKGYRVLTAGDGIEAVETFMKHRREIAAVVTDLDLPRLGGWQSCVAMREIKPEVRIIVASGFIEPSVKAEMITGGVDAFIEKPYEPAEILRRIREVLAVP